jgi:hypothetical protein
MDEELEIYIIMRQHSTDAFGISPALSDLQDIIKKL